jgi:phage gp46-like protein
MSWKIDPNSGDYVMTGGAPVDSNSLQIPAYYRLKIERTQWLYAPDNKYGSDLYKLQKNFTTGDAGFIETVMNRALQPIVDDGRAAQIEVTATVRGRHAVGLETKITDAQGNVETLTLKGIGV